MNKSPFKSVRRTLLAGCATLAMAPALAFAQADPQAAVSFDIPAQSLDGALTYFGQQSGREIIASAASTRDRRAPALHGDYTPEQALDILLADTGLSYRKSASGSIVVEVAQDPQGGSAEGTGASTVEALIVTAQKKEEAIQDVPIAISAFTQKSLDEQKLEGGFDLLKAIPNVTFSKTNFTGYNFSIRGIGTQAISATTDPAVAVSFNSSTLIVNRLFEQEYVDVERVEVLRGPQGTLYGRNATSGVINVVSAKPVMGDFFGEMKLEGGNYNARRVRGHVNVPIGETFAIRGAYASTKRDGFGYNEYDGSDVDDRDLWTSRITLGWEPTDKLRVNLLWEHFEEDDERVRTSKQLCTRDTGFITEEAVNSAGFTQPETFYYSSLSQGCKAGSLYADAAYGTPNGASLPYVSALYWGPYYADFPFIGDLVANRAHGVGGSPYLARPGTAAQPCIVPGFPAGCPIPAGPPQPPLIEPPCPQSVPFTGGGAPAGIGLLPVNVCTPDIYRGAMQSRDLRTISSQLKPKYVADSDVFDLTIDLDLTDALSFTSQTVYAKDTYYATQDYNRFTAFSIWEDTSAACGITGNQPDPTAANLNCSDDPNFGVGTFAPIPNGNGDFLRDEDGRRIGFYRDLAPRPEGSPLGTPGVFCDPQLGCSDTLLIQDLSQSKSTQFNQEFRLSSNFDAPWNFSLGTNITRFQTRNDYYVFANALTYLLNVFPFAYHNSQCVQTSTLESYADSVLNADPYRAYDGQFCRYVDPNPLESINGEGHNYFRSDNPYKLTSGAVFGELYWNATETLKFTAGARLTWDRKVFTPIPSQLLLGDYRQTTGINPGDGPERCVNFITTCALAGSSIGGRGSPASPDIIQEWLEPTGRLVVSWSPDLAFTNETMLYGSISHGYKGGGANPPSVDVPAKFLFDRASGGQPDLFLPEYVDAFEAGAKNTLLDGALVLNGAAFFYDYQDYQVSKIVDRRAVNENFDAKVWGAELEAVFSPTRNLRFNTALGYLHTEVADGELSIDLMDRTDGGNRHFANPDSDFPNGFDEWIVVQPWISAASNCIVPKELMEANFLGISRNFTNAYCPTGNVAATNTAQVSPAYFDEDGNYVRQQDSRRFYDPFTDAPNGGAGFYKDVGGNDLPNAPHWTAAFGAQYRLELPGGWDATLRGDFYWQSQSYARIYNYEPYDKLRAWTNTNISLWAENRDWGVKAEVYVKNVFDETPITGAFLNSDDSGLTTNVFTLEPRLVGASVTKSF